MRTRQPRETGAHLGEETMQTLHTKGQSLASGSVSHQLLQQSLLHVRDLPLVVPLVVLPFLYTAST